MGEGAALAEGPSKTAFSFALVLMRNYEPNPQPRGRWSAWSTCGWLTKGWASSRRTPLLAAQPPGLSQFQQVARTPFQRKPPSALGSVPPTAPRASIGCRASANRGQCRLRLHALQQVAGLLQTGFSAACGFTRINFLPSIDFDTSMQPPHWLLRCRHAIGASQRRSPTRTGILWGFCAVTIRGNGECITADSRPHHPHCA